MNLQITNEISAATNSAVTYDTKGDTTTYHLSKEVNGKQTTVDVEVSADIHANGDAMMLAEHVVKRAAVKFAELRKNSEKKNQILVEVK